MDYDDDPLLGAWYAPSVPRIADVVCALYEDARRHRKVPRPHKVGFNIKVPPPYARPWAEHQQRVPVNPFCRAYTSATHNRSTLEALRLAGWRMLVSASSKTRAPGFPYAIDNGAWSAHLHKTPFDTGAFSAILDELGDGADWVVAPDIVEGGIASLRLTETWLPRLVGRVERVLVAVQDGITVDDMRPLLAASPREVGIFLGGSTEWKVANIPVWAELAEEVGCYYHVGRVNTVKRIRMCRYARAHSFDGTSPVKFPKSLPLLDNARKELLPCLPL